MNSDNQIYRWKQVSIRTLGLLALFFAAGIAFDRAASETGYDSNAAKLKQEIASLNVRLAHIYEVKRSLPKPEAIEESNRMLQFARAQNIEHMLAHSHKSLAAAISQLESISNKPSQ